MTGIWIIGRNLPFISEEFWIVENKSLWVVAHLVKIVEMELSNKTAELFQGEECWNYFLFHSLNIFYFDSFSFDVPGDSMTIVGVLKVR